MAELPAPTISVAIELDNAAFEDYHVWSARIRRLCDWMHESLAESIVEIFLVHGESHAAGVSDFLAAPWADYCFRLKALPVADSQAHYYAMKNAAAEQAVGELIAFLDSDLTPCSGTFEAFVSPLYDTMQVISCGYTSFPLDTFIAKVYALNWVFPIHPFTKSIGKKALLASNFVARRDWFLSNKFETDLGGFKVACTVMSRTLTRQGYVINRPDVWFWHAVWHTSWRFFVWRALVMGRDADRKFACLGNDRRVGRIRFCLGAFVDDLRHIRSRHRLYGRGAGLSSAGMILSVCAGSLFYMLVRSAQFSSALRAVNRDVEWIPGRFVT